MADNDTNGSAANGATGDAGADADGGDVAVKLGRKDFQSDQEVRWCPGCGDYSILAAMQLELADIGVRPENLVFVSGIGCAARFPYYMNTYGLHSIHGRAPAVATGVALGASRPRRLGDRRRRRHAVDRWQPPDPRAAPQRQPEDHHVQQPDLRAHEGPVLADERGRQDHEVVAVRLARHAVQPGVGRARARRPRSSPRTHDMDRNGMMDAFRRAHEHQGSAFVEIYQNCNVFNDGAFEGDHREGSPRRHAHRARARPADPLRRRPRAGRDPQRVRRVRDRERRRRRRGAAPRARRAP